MSGPAFPEIAASLPGCRLEWTLESAVPPAVQEELAALLDVCFPDTFESRTFFKQLPAFRLLGWKDGALAGQVGIDSRVINAGGKILTIFGLIDLCVHPRHQGGGLATGLLAEVETLARQHRRDALVLMADRHGLYLKAGYRRIQPAPVKWLGIDGLEAIGVLERDLGSCFMVKPLSFAAWPPGVTDLLGYLF